jgi:hypothetical protein
MCINEIGQQRLGRFPTVTIAAGSLFASSHNHHSLIALLISFEAVKSSKSSISKRAVGRARTGSPRGDRKTRGDLLSEQMACMKRCKDIRKIKGG